MEENDTNVIVESKRSEDMLNPKKRLYKKILYLIPALRTAQPGEPYWIGTEQEGASISISPLCQDSGKEISVNICRTIWNEVAHYNPNNPAQIIKKGCLNAPSLNFLFKRATEEIQGTSMWDDRTRFHLIGDLDDPADAYNLNEALNGYIDEFIDAGYAQR